MKQKIIQQIMKQVSTNHETGFNRKNKNLLYRVRSDNFFLQCWEFDNFCFLYVLKNISTEKILN